MPLRILFVPFGSEGDVNPLLWLAEGMAARGHEPTFLITPHYGRLVQRRGFSWVPVGTEEEFVRFARDPRLWHNAQGTKMVVQGMLETLPVYREGFATAGSDFDVVVLSTMAMGAASVAESIGLPRVTLHLQPALFRSVYDCPVFMEQLAWLPRSPRWVKRGFFSLVDARSLGSRSQNVKCLPQRFGPSAPRRFLCRSLPWSRRRGRVVPGLVCCSATGLAAEGPPIRLSNFN